jgi:hypothetical protein
MRKLWTKRTQEAKMASLKGMSSKDVTGSEDESEGEQEDRNILAYRKSADTMEVWFVDKEKEKCG